MAVWQSHKTMLSLLGALTILVVADGLLTRFLVGSGIGREGNPFLATWVGNDWFLAIKGAGAVICAVILWDIYRQFPRMGTIATSCLAGAYALITAWNTVVYLVWG